MPRPEVVEVDALTGQHIVREMTNAEYAQYQKDQEEAEAQKTLLKARSDARQSALEKLAGLGLTEEEIQALLGP